MERTRDLLFRPFRAGTLLKLGAVAFFAEASGSLSLTNPGRMGGLPDMSPQARAILYSVVLAAGIGLVLFSLVLFYVGSRLQLVMVELVATRAKVVGPLWRKSGRLTWRWVGVRALFFLSIVIVVAAVAGPFFFAILKHPPPPGTMPINFFGNLLLVLAIALPLILVLGVVYILLRDFALPFVVFEGLPVTTAVCRVRSLLAAEGASVALYVLLRFSLVVVGALAAEITIVFVLLISLIPVGLVGGVLWFFLRNSGPLGTGFLIGAGIVGGGLFLVWMMCVAIAVFGAVFLFTQAYALYFLGGRYPMLGEILDRTSPPPAFAGYPPGWPGMPGAPGPVRGAY